MLTVLCCCAALLHTLWRSAAAQLSLLTLFLINFDVSALVASSMAVYPMATILLIKYGECSTGSQAQGTAWVDGQQSIC